MGEARCPNTPGCEAMYVLWGGRGTVYEGRLIPTASQEPFEYQAQLD